MKWSDIICENAEPVAADIQSPALKAWFAGSKVVDAHGKPLRVYHGTDMVFMNFAKGHVPSLAGDDAHGFYFTSDPNYAANYGDIIMPVFLKIIKPFVVSAESYEYTTIKPKRFAELQAMGCDGMIFYGSPSEKRPSEYVVFHDHQIRSAIVR